MRVERPRLEALEALRLEAVERLRLEAVERLRVEAPVRRALVERVVPLLEVFLWVSVAM